MGQSFSIRPVHSNDASDILEIYRPVVLNTAISFETEVPGEEAFKERIKTYSTHSPWLVAQSGNHIIGYAYATAHRSRQAYQWNQEVTVYVHKNFRKQGVAKALYTKLLELLGAMGFRRAMAIITLPNAPSVSFHRKLGFKHIGVMKSIGFKLGKWHDTSWWDLDLQPNTSTPENIRPLKEVLHLI